MHHSQGNHTQKQNRQSYLLAQRDLLSRSCTNLPANKKTSMICWSAGLWYELT
jgi:hypothetical protein